MNLSLGDRMKSYYENINRNYLIRKTPVIIRLDGVAFHTKTKHWNLEKPFSDLFINSMRNTAKKLVNRMMGAKVAYVASDEISILLTDLNKITTDAWFDYNVQKLVSVSASFATLYFNEEMAQNTSNKYDGCFDARCFNIPSHEVENYFFWRWKDFERNSIHMLAHSLYSTNELKGKKCSDMHEMIYQKNKNWSLLPNAYKNGTFLFQNFNNDWVFYDESYTEYIRQLIRNNAAVPKEE